MDRRLPSERRSPGARRPSAPAAGRRVVLSNHDRPRARLTPRRPDPGRRSRGCRTGRSRAPADPARDAVPLLRRGARDGRRRHPGGRVGRSPRRPGRPGLLVVGSLALPDADALGTGPGAGFTTGRPWLRLGPDAETRNVAVAGGRPDLGPVDSIAGSSRCGRRRPALQVGDAAPAPRARRRMSSPTRARRMARSILVVLNLGRARVLRGGCPMNRPRCGWRASSGPSQDSLPGSPIDGRCDARSSVPTKPSSSSGSADRRRHRPCYHDGRSISPLSGSTTCRLNS